MIYYIFIWIWRLPSDIPPWARIILKKKTSWCNLIFTNVFSNEDLYGFASRKNEKEFIMKKKLTRKFSDEFSEANLQVFE